MLRTLGTQLIKELDLPAGEYPEGGLCDLSQAVFEELTKRSLIETSRGTEKQVVLPAKAEGK